MSGPPHNYHTSGYQSYGQAQSQNARQYTPNGQSSSSASFRQTDGLELYYGFSNNDGRSDARSHQRPNAPNASNNMTRNSAQYPSDQSNLHTHSRNIPGGGAHSTSYQSHSHPSRQLSEIHSQPQQQQQQAPSYEASSFAAQGNKALSHQSHSRSFPGPVAHTNAQQQCTSYEGRHQHQGLSTASGYQPADRTNGARPHGSVSRTPATPSPVTYQNPRQVPQQPVTQRGSDHQTQAVQPQTVDPSQFHDSYIELQRRRAMEAEATMRVDEYNKRVEEEQRRVAEEARRQADEDARRKTEEDARRKAENSRNVPGNASNNEQLESEMRAMFLKMREFNQKDPALLQKLWAQEHENHATSVASKRSQPGSAQSPQTSSSASRRDEMSRNDPSTSSNDPLEGQQNRSTSDVNQPSSSATTASEKSRMTGKKPGVPQQVQISTQTPNGSVPGPHPQRNTPQPNDRPSLSGSPHPSLSSVASASKMFHTMGKKPAPAQQAQSSAKSPAVPSVSTVSSPAPTKNIWPESKKLLLSAAASALIKQVPENQNRTLDPSDIARILEQNPSYVQLCEEIERKGFALNRAAFAKGLLAVVPENGTSPRSPPSGPTQPPPAQSGPSTTPLAPGAGNIMPQPLSNQTPGTAPSSGMSAPKENHNPRLAQHDRSRPEKIYANGRIIGVTIPPKKEDKARKRNFSELVDLTQLSDDEPPAKRPTGPHSVPDGQGSTSGSQLLAQGDMASAPVGASLPQGTNAFQHVVPPKKRPDIPVGHPLSSQPAVKKLDKHKAIRRSTYNPKTIARDVLLASGRHPDMRPLNAHLEVLRNPPLALKDDSDLATLRWDLIDPGGLPVGAGMAEDLDEVELDEPANYDSESGGEILGRRGIRAGLATGNGSDALATPMSARFGPNTIGLKKASGTPRSGPRQNGATGNNTSFNPRPTTAGLGQRQASDSPGAQGAYSALRAANASKGIAPTRGRPVGWRKWMQQTPDGSTSKSASKSASAPRNRPKSPPEPDYKPFKCEWEGCGVELHNLDTLRRHVFKLHCVPSGGHLFPCLWADCGTVVTRTIGEATTARKTRREFPSGPDWRIHQEAVHLTSVAWAQGDGPAAGLSDRGASAGELSDAYMSDAEGRSITPRVEMPAVRGFTAVNTPRQGRVSALEEARTELRAVQERRERLGVGIDAGGARSIDDELRKGFHDGGEDDEMVLVDDADLA